MVSSSLNRTKLWVDLDAVSDITGVEISKLIEWQKAFHPFLDPEVVRGEPRFSKEDIAVVLQIKRLMHEGGLRVEGARRALAWTIKRAA